MSNIIPLKSAMGARKRINPHLLALHDTELALENIHTLSGSIKQIGRDQTLPIAVLTSLAVISLMLRTMQKRLARIREELK